MTSDTPWDPDSYNDDHHSSDMPSTTLPPLLADTIEECIHIYKHDILVSKPKCILPHKPDLNLLRPLFGWCPTTRIRDTLRCTTQWYKAEGRLPMRRHFKSRFPGANVPRREEMVATDTIF